MADDTELDDMMMVTIVEDDSENSTKVDKQALLEFENSGVDEWVKYFDENYETYCYKNSHTGKTSWVRPDGYSSPREDVNKSNNSKSQAQGTILPKVPRWSDGYKPTASIADELPSMYDSEDEDSNSLDNIDSSESKSCHEDEGITKSREKVTEKRVEGLDDKERKLKVVKSMSVKVCELMINTATEEAAHRIQLQTKPKRFDEQIETINMEAEDRNYFKKRIMKQSDKKG